MTRLGAARERWDGPRWRWWALAVGLALTGLCALLGAALGALFNADVPSLILLFVTLALFISAIIGAGLLERVTGRVALSQGLERQPPAAQPHARQPLDPRAPIERTPEMERRDRNTIRAGLVVLPLLAVFIGLLFF